MVVTGAPRKRLVGKPARGFESHPLRHFPFQLYLLTTMNINSIAYL